MSDAQESLVNSYSGWDADEVARNPRVVADVIERLRSRLLAEFRRSDGTEWEYGNEHLMHSRSEIFPASDEEAARKSAWLHPVHRRRKAGPWMPVEQIGDAS